MRRFVYCLTLVLLPLCAHAEVEISSRFTGSGALTTPEARSSDGRFELDAELQAAPTVRSNGRFALNAKLALDAKSLATACAVAGVDIFKNSFE